MSIAAFPDWQWLPASSLRRHRRSAVTGVVQHYTGAGDGRALARWLAGPDARVSAHLVICRDGHVIQQVSFNHEAFHAGESNDVGLWKGLPQPMNVNAFTIGIENSNYGWLIESEGGSFWTKKKVDGEWVKARPYAGPKPHRAPDHLGVMRWWEPFSEALVKANVAVLRRIIELYPEIGPEDIQGHSSISPHRRFDPGPMWPWEYVESCVWGRPPMRVSPLSWVPKDAEVNPRDYYDERTQMCMEPLKKGV